MCSGRATSCSGSVPTPIRSAIASSPAAPPTSSTTPPASSPSAANSASTPRKNSPAKALNARGLRSFAWTNACGARSTNSSKLVLDEVTQVLQFDGEVHVVDHHFLRHLQNDRREIQNAGDPAA